MKHKIRLRGTRGIVAFVGILLTIGLVIGGFGAGLALTAHGLIQTPVDLVRVAIGLGVMIAAYWSRHLVTLLAIGWVIRGATEPRPKIDTSTVDISKFWPN